MFTNLASKEDSILLKYKATNTNGPRDLTIDIDKNEALMEQYRIQSVPTLMLFRKGDALWRQSGAMSLSDLKKVVNSYQE